jgi:hypothetical protein
MAQEIPIQPVENPILCNPWDEPGAHWVYNPQTGVPTKQQSRRQAGYWYKTESNYNKGHDGRSVTNLRKKLKSDRLLGCVNTHYSESC